MRSCIGKSSSSGPTKKAGRRRTMRRDLKIDETRRTRRGFRSGLRRQSRSVGSGAFPSTLNPAPAKSTRPTAASPHPRPSRDLPRLASIAPKTPRLVVRLRTRHPRTRPWRASTGSASRIRATRPLATLRWASRDWLRSRRKRPRRLLPSPLDNWVRSRRIPPRAVAAITFRCSRSLGSSRPFGWVRSRRDRGSNLNKNGVSYFP